MKKDFPKCSSSSSIRAAVDVMEKMNVDYMPVEEEGKIKGVVTSRELAGYPSSRLILDCAIQPVATISAETLVDEALGVLEKRKVVFLMVLDKKGTPVGVINREVVVSSLCEQLKRVDKEKEEYITGRKRVEEMLRESEAFKSALFEYNPIETIVVDSEGRVTDFNLAKKHSGNKLPKIGNVMYKDYAGKHEIGMHAELMKCIRAGKPREFPEQKYGNKFLSITTAPFPHGAIITSQDITDRRRGEEILKSSRERLRRLSAHLRSVREEERMRIASRIHDELGQALTALKMDASWLSKKFSREQKPLREKTKLMLALVDTMVKTVQGISTELRPSVLDHLGLSAAIESEIEEFKKRVEIKVETKVDKEMVVDKERSITIFRICQELLTNIARHANATRVRVNLRENLRKLVLEVKDNGRGIREKEISDHRSFGLTEIQERALSWGGKVKIKGIPGKGTTVTVSIPND